MLPEKFIERMRIDLGSEYDVFIKSYDKPFVKSLRINIRKNAEGILPGAMKISDIDSSKARIPWEESGLYYTEEDDGKLDVGANCENALFIDSPGKSPLHAAGAYYIQEASAMLPVNLLELDTKGLKVLDLCAAPGGKTTQIADKLGNEGIIVCNEIIGSRAKILSENIERMAVRNAVVISEDPNRLKDRFPNYFDRILVDAPCSGEGMFRKHPEAADEWSVDNVRLCADRQDMILDCAANMLAPGGKIVYSTCTFSRDEDEGSVQRFLARHPEFEVLGEGHRLYPHIDRGEGHFAAEFVHKSDKPVRSLSDNVSEVHVDSSVEEMVFYTGKAVNSSDKKKDRKSRKNQKGGSKNQKNCEAIDLLIRFCKENMNYCDALGVTSDDDFERGFAENITSRIILFGDRIFLAPEGMPDINGLTVLRPGLHLGTIMKDRFEPSHAFALALTPNEVKYFADYEDTSMELQGYLKGQTINYDGQKGWYLVCVDGLSLGWGKLTGTVLKNHYPKGLRVMG